MPWIPSTSADARLDVTAVDGTPLDFEISTDAGDGVVVVSTSGEVLDAKCLCLQSGDFLKNSCSSSCVSEDSASRNIDDELEFGFGDHLRSKTKAAKTGTDDQDNQKSETGNLLEGVRVGCDPAGDPDLAPEGVPAESSECMWFDLTSGDGEHTSTTDPGGVPYPDKGLKHISDQGTVDPEWPILTEYAALTFEQRWPTEPLDLLALGLDRPLVQDLDAQACAPESLEIPLASIRMRQVCPGSLSPTTGVGSVPPAGVDVEKETARLNRASLPSGQCGFIRGRPGKTPWTRSVAQKLIIALLCVGLALVGLSLIHI